MKQELFILRQKQTISQTATTPPTEAPAASTPIVDTAKQTPPISPPAPVLEVDDRINNILMVGDSISGNLHKKTIETATKAKLRITKAYSSIHENVTDTGF